NLQESMVRLAEVPEADPYWQGAPKSQSLDRVLSDFLEMELRQRPNDERVLWSLAALAVHHCVNNFGRDYLVPLCIKDPKNVRWFMESGIWVLDQTGTRTTNDLREGLQRIERQV